MNANSYKKASTFYLIGNIFNKGIAFLTVPIFTRILGTNDYGLVNTYSSWIGIITMFIGFTLHMGIRSSFIDFRSNVREYLSTVIKFTLLTSSAVILVTLGIIKIFNLNVPILLVLLCLIHSSACAIIEDVSYYFMMTYSYIKRTIILVLPNLVSVVLSIIIISFVMKNDLYLGRIIPDAATMAAVGLVLSVIFIKKDKINKTYLKHGLKISAPLILHGAALNILSQSDRIMITWLVNASQSGIYSLVYSLGMISSVIISALDGIWIPWFTEKMNTNSKDEINKISVYYAKIITYIMCCLIMVAPEILKILASKPYWEGIKIIPLIIAANYISFMYTFYVNIEHYYKKTMQISTLTIFAAVLNIILNYLLIPKFGYVAAALTTMISYLTILFLHSYFAKKIEPTLYPLKMFVLPIIEISAFCGLFYLLIDKPIIRWITAIVYFGVVAYIQRKKIVTILLPNFKAKFIKK